MSARSVPYLRSLRDPVIKEYTKTFCCGPGPSKLTPTGAGHISRQSRPVDARTTPKPAPIYPVQAANLSLCTTWPHYSACSSLLLTSYPAPNAALSNASHFNHVQRPFITDFAASAKVT